MGLPEQSKPNAFPYVIEGTRVVITAPNQAEADRLAGESLAERQRERDRLSKWPLTPSGTIDTTRAIVALARKFPSLAERIPGIEPWNPLELLRWIVLGGHSHGEVLAAKFVLGVWNNADWQEVANEDPDPLAEYRRLCEEPRGKIVLTKFSLFEAMSVWDDEHRTGLIYLAERSFLALSLGRKMSECPLSRSSRA
jgi:hypothetical protein